jgi:peptidoglycan/xylan/chitin deacetylase (PgdA/CDA1 family)
MNRRDFNKLLIFTIFYNYSKSNLLANKQTENQLTNYGENLLTLPDNLSDTALYINKDIKNPNKIQKYYLTLDDGYLYQEEMINIANEKNIKLNLFIIGKIIEQDPKLWLSAIEQGHLLGSHSYSHLMFSKNSYQKITTDFEIYKQKISNVIGLENFQKIKYFRFPYGDEGSKRNKQDINKLITETYGWNIVRWDLDLSFNHQVKFRSFSHNEQIATYQHYSNNTKKDKNVILLHFKQPDNLCLKSFIDFGLEQNFEFMRLDDKKDINLLFEKENIINNDDFESHKFIL